MSKHPNYHILNLIGYGLAKYDRDLIRAFGFKSQRDLFSFFVEAGIAETIGVVKNRMDLFDPFFETSPRKGWWQKGDTYLHRKHHIDAHFGHLAVDEYVAMIRLAISELNAEFSVDTTISPIIKSRYRALQNTGKEAEQFFMDNYQITSLSSYELEDARLYGDGYDFLLEADSQYRLVEVKGIRECSGYFRLTEKEYAKALEYKEHYIVCIVFNLNTIPVMKLVPNPIEVLPFTKSITTPKDVIDYRLAEVIYAPEKLSV